jgi:hypothetical protein
MGAPASPPPAIFWHLQSRPIPGSLNIEQKYVPFQTPIMKTPYMVMTLQANEAPARDNILAGLFSWLTLGIATCRMVYKGTLVFHLLQKEASLRACSLDDSQPDSTASSNVVPFKKGIRIDCSY